ncbi:neuronal PAS domain-containing protein 4-like [Solea senegalensis]|nr:neuronal PAS domain-containing protein 4-like [Solea senegalensis]KAG7511534.1 neuronal PAS domain-containing protein 4-like [Solea senegalensis]
MTQWCNSCRCHVRSPCVFHHLPQEQEHEPRAVCRRMRSTKGASKARRDHINHEIRNMRALLPITESDRERLSYLHSMAAICTYIRKSILLQGISAGERPHCSLPYQAFLQALHGFIVVTTTQGRLVYVSENVAEYLGLSMIDVLQGDSFYDVVEHSDIDTVKSNLAIENNSSSERSFICCMQTSKAFKLQHGSCCSMLVRGRFLFFPEPCPSSSSAASLTPQPLFVALCTPTVNRLRSCDSHFCHSFTSIHRLDMTFTQLSDSVSYYLGYSASEMTGRSWYGLIHPDDLSSSADSHRSLMDTDEDFQVQMVLRLQCEDLSWTWLYIQANKDLQGISCMNYIISETEARFLQKQVGSDAFRPSSMADTCNAAGQQDPQTQTYNNNKCFKRQRTPESQSEEPGPRRRRESEYELCIYSQDEHSPVPSGESPALFTLPYSPDSSSSPLQQEELSHDLLRDMHEFKDQLLSSPEASPSYYSYTDAVFTYHQTNPISPPAAPEHTFDQGSFNAHSPFASTSPTYGFQPCTSDTQLVPDCLSASNMCETAVDRALHQDDFSLLEQPEGGSLGQEHHVPQHLPPLLSGLLTPNQSPPSTESNHYNEMEQAEISILAAQISSLTRSFDMYHNQNDWPHQSPLNADPSPQCELVLDDCVFDSILKDLDMVARKSTVVSCSLCQQTSACRCGLHHLEQELLGLHAANAEDTLSTEQLADMDPFSLQMGHRDQNTGLHQLNHYMQSNLQLDGLAKENLC